jgi:hypothetical protein
MFRVANEKTTFADAFALADEVLYSGVACISDLIVKEGLINLDFADVLTVMRRRAKPSTSSLMRDSNFTFPTIPTLRPKLRKVPRRSFSMAIAFDCSSLRWVSSIRSF